MTSKPRMYSVHMIPRFAGLLELHGQAGSSIPPQLYSAAQLHAVVLEIRHLKFATHIL